MGRNTRTYKFALGQALLTMARQGHDAVSMEALAVPYALAIAEHAQHAPQVSTTGALGDQDYLQVLADESAVTLSTRQPTDRLIAATVKSMPAMVMQKFHNLPGATQVPHQFYDIRRNSDGLTVTFTPELLQVAQRHDTSTLDEELQARWSLVECTFDTGIGRSLVRLGAGLSDDGLSIIEPVRRAPVATSRAALIGFQHGRCFYCHEPIDDVNSTVHVDHVFAYSLMHKMMWTGPDLNGVWNLVVTHGACNLTKRDRLPNVAEIQQLHQRNEAIVMSPHPLSKAITRLTGNSEPSRAAFLASILNHAHDERVLFTHSTDNQQ